MKVAVIGTGFVGVVTAGVLASFGNEVVGLDIDQKKVELLRKSIVPFFEPGLTELLAEQQRTQNLTFTTDYATAIRGAQVVLIAVGTPSQESGEVDLGYVYSACDQLAPYLAAEAVVVVKSTVPPGTLSKVTAQIQKHTAEKFYTASVPEFLKEGTAVTDTLHPDRIVIGVVEDTAFAILQKLHEPFQAPVIRVSPESAQMGKYAANSYLALRIAFINQIADLCEHNGADVTEVIAVMGHDARIGTHYWYPGLGYGGSCFPKDVKELAHYSKEVGSEDNLLVKLNQVNEKRIPMLLEKFSKQIGGWTGKKVAVLGLSFKPNTDDMREAPSTKVIPLLLTAGATIQAYDPQATSVAEKYFMGQNDTDRLQFAKSVAAAVADVDVVLVLIEWKEIVEFDYGSVKSNKPQWLIDTRNQLDPAVVANWGYSHIGIGRGKKGVA
jgi:UDPglucose 6-dehydrogenase